MTKSKTKFNQNLPVKRMTVVLGLFFLAASVILLTLRGAIIPGIALAAVGLLIALIATRWPPRNSGSHGDHDGPHTNISTDYLDVKVNAASQTMQGVVRKGLFEGQQIRKLHPAELALIWQDCRADDHRSAQLIEAHLDALHPRWRDDVRRGEEQFASGPDGQMNIKEAYKILGLSSRATHKQVRTAHRDLMLKLHPDRGGSTYLASKINEAKDVLLSKLEP